MTRTAHVNVLLTVQESDIRYETDEDATWAASKEIQFEDHQKPQHLANAYAEEFRELDGVEVLEVSVSETIYQ